MLNGVNTAAQEGKKKSFIRGQFMSENMPAWEREEKMKKHNVRQDTQNVLLQQIKEKEIVKARQEEERKMEEEREQSKLLRDQELLKERYEREAEEGKRKMVWVLLSLYGRKKRGSRMKRLLRKEPNEIGSFMRNTWKPGQRRLHHKDLPRKGRNLSSQRLFILNFAQTLLLFLRFRKRRMK